MSCLLSARRITTSEKVFQLLFDVVVTIIEDAEPFFQYLIWFCL
jgi:hypothetical protein